MYRALYLELTFLRGHEARIWANTKECPCLASFGRLF